jgi:hypothetical protein
MDTEIYRKQNIKGNLIPFILLLLLGVVFTSLLVSTDKVVFAQQQEYLPDTEIKKVFFLPDLTTERISYGYKLITIEKDHNIYKILTKSTDVFEILRENGISIERNDAVTLSTRYVLDGTIIRVVRTDKILVVKFFDIPFEEQIVENSAYLKGQKNIKQRGVNGVMKQQLLNTYENGYLVESELISQVVDRKPVPQIVEVGTSEYLLQDIEIRGYNCPYWYSVVDSGPYSDEEKRWLKFIMYCESGCNAESDKSTYKGLFQWSPYWWKKQFTENIFDGNAQIKHTIEKYRAGESTRENQWPACHARYVRTYGSN